MADTYLQVRTTEADKQAAAASIKRYSIASGETYGPSQRCLAAVSKN